MKKITLLTVLMLIISIGLINAQSNKGKVLFGISSTLGLGLNLAGPNSDLMIIGFSTVKRKSDAEGYEENEPYKMTRINFLPKVGYFVVDNLALGLGLNVALSINKAGDGKSSSKYSQNLLSLEPFIRYYIPTSKALPFFEISGSYGILNGKYYYIDNNNEDDQEFKSSVTSVGGGIGLAAPLGEKVALEVLAGYNSLTLKNKKDNDDNERSVSGTFGLKIGFTIMLGSK